MPDAMAEDDLVDVISDHEQMDGPVAGAHVLSKTPQASGSPSVVVR